MTKCPPLFIYLTLVTSRGDYRVICLDALQLWNIERLLRIANPAQETLEQN